MAILRNFQLLVYTFLTIWQQASAHVYLSSINGLTEGDCIRPQQGLRDYPINNLTSGDITYGFLPGGAQPANRFCPVSAGSPVLFEFHHGNNSAIDDIIDGSHRGPCMVYMASVPASGQNPAWFKIWQYGLDAKGFFCVDYLRNNSGVDNAGRGRFAAIIPSYLPSGNYLVRTEIIALHNAYLYAGAQFYVNTAQVSVTNTATTGLVNVANIPTVSFPGAYWYYDTGIYYNLYNYGGLLPYSPPGPSVYSPSLITSSTGAPVISTPSTAAPVTSSPVTSSPAAPAKGAITIPTGGKNTIKIQVHPSSSLWWLAIEIIGASQTTASARFRGSGTYKKGWTDFSLTNYGYFYFGSGQIAYPIDVQITSVTGDILEFVDIIHSLSPGSIIDTLNQYGGSPTTSSSPSPTKVPATTSSPTYTPITQAPVVTSTSAPVVPSTAAPTQSTASGSSLKLQVFSGSSQWWFAVTIVDSSSAIVKVEVKSAGTTVYNALALQTWGAWTYGTTGGPMSTLVTVRITSASGNVLVVNNVSVAQSLLDTETVF